MSIIEINGIKLEIDERTARTVESYKVGDRVKVLVKRHSTYEVHAGVIIGFAAFKALPTIEIMYLSANSWDTDALKFVAVNAESTDIEIAPMNDAEVVLDRADVVARIDREIRSARHKLEDLERKRAYFLERYAAAFEPETVQ